MEKMENKRTFLESLVEGMSESQLVATWNQRCDDLKYYDDRVYYMEEINDLLGNLSFSEGLEKLADNFRVSDGFFRDTIYGLESFEFACDYIDNDELIDYLLNNDIECVSDEIDSDEAYSAIINEVADATKLTEAEKQDFGEWLQGTDGYSVEAAWLMDEFDLIAEYRDSQED